MATSAAPVVLIRLHRADVFDEDIMINMDKLAEIYNAEVVTEEERFVTRLKHQMPKVAVLADNAVTLPENEDLRGLLYEYIKAGGMVILAFQYAAMCNDNELDNTFKDLGLPMWTHASSSMSAHTRTNLGRNPTMRAVFGEAAFATMKESYDIEAAHIEGVEDREKFYVPLRFDWNVTKINGRDSACTSAFTRVGAGYLGYVGDFPFLYGTVRVLKVMIDKALGTPASVHAPSTYTSANTVATVSGPSNPNEPRSEAPNQRSTTAETEDAWEQANNEDEDDEEDFGLPDGFEGLNLDDEDEFDRSWS